MDQDGKSFLKIFIKKIQRRKQNFKVLLRNKPSPEIFFREDYLFENRDEMILMDEIQNVFIKEKKLGLPSLNLLVNSLNKSFFMR